MRALRCALLCAILALASGVTQNRHESPSCSCVVQAKVGFTNSTCACAAEKERGQLVNSLVGFLGVSSEATTKSDTVTHKCHCAATAATGHNTESCDCDASLVECPDFSDGHPKCHANKGYYGTVVWDVNTEKYKIIDDEGNSMDRLLKRDCPGPSDHWPNCTCNVGYSGSVVWNSQINNYESTCTFEACPNNANVEPLCKCQPGYKEIEEVVWNAPSQTWFGKCEPVSCPPLTKSAKHPDCDCKHGYIGGTSWVEETESFTTTCALASCPTNATHIGGDAVNAATCQCNVGYAEADSDLLRFVAKEGWAGSCQKEDCPLNSDHHPNCKCDVGYLGSPAFNTATGEYDGSCETAACPAGSDADCRCLKGYVSAPREPAWDATEGWTHTCAASTCPEGSTETNPSACKCDAHGFSGTTEWNGETWSACAVEACPSHASLGRDADGNRICVCGIGYHGKISWSADTSSWAGSCDVSECPTHATCLPAEKAACNRGYTHNLTWHEETSTWSATCSKLECPGGSFKFPNCTCQVGYSGGDENSLVAFHRDGATSYYGCLDGECDDPCEFVQCPTHSTRNQDGSCTCNKGYTGEITWDGKKKAYEGSCAAQPCPTGSVVEEGSDCACSKGYLRSADWGFSDGKWHGGCELQSCPNPAFSEAGPDCDCKPGAYYENNKPIVFDFANGYIGRCIPWPCPEGAKVDGQCYCGEGYATFINGALSPALSQWNTDGHWDHSCKRIPCTAGADDAEHPSCKCLSGYRGETAWNGREGRWSPCVEIPCKANAELIRATTAGEQAKCRCMLGNSGNMVWNAESQDWDGECVRASCPDLAVCTEKSATCKKGYTGTVTWDAEEAEWDAQCEPVECPENSSNHTECHCNTGYSGGLLSFDGKEYSKCTVVDCPDHSTRLHTGECVCQSGYAGAIEWQGSHYTGECVLAACPPNGGTGPNCTCDHGHKPTVDFGFSDVTRTWTGQCVGVACPENCKEPFVECVCDVGYRGIISFDAATHSFSGQCEVAKCPTHASGPDCKCVTGYTGVPAYNGTHWNHECVPAECPDNSAKEDLGAAGYMCHCDAGFAGKPLWTGTQWTDACAGVSCPTFSSTRDGDLTKCHCRDGFVGDVNWLTQTQKYDSICKPQNCPAHTFVNETLNRCDCIPGYTGNCSWGGNDWVCTCSPGDCPDNADFDEAIKLCKCAEGYSGELKWVEQKDDYDGRCHRVECADAVPNSVGTPHPTCECAPGYRMSEDISWDLAEKTYKGKCEIEACPNLSEGEPSCKCIHGARNKPGNALTWADDIDQYEGECEYIPCPAFAGTNPPNCACIDGYAPVNLGILGEEWVGECEIRACPGGHGTAPNCGCKKGYSGSVTWNSESFEWESQCVQETCPDNASNDLTCECLEGFSGTPIWNAQTQKWDHTCATVDCPDNSGPHPGCKCQSGYSGDIFWNTPHQNYTGACTIIPCPQGSVRRTQKLNESAPIAGCDCFVGFSGGYDFVGQAYQGQCQWQVPPASAEIMSLTAQPGLTDTVYPCKTGYKGNVTWTGTQWINRCIKVACPVNSHGYPSCKCKDGYAGQVLPKSTVVEVEHGRTTLFEYESTCEFVSCPLDIMNRTTYEGSLVCECPVGSQGRAVWSDSSFTATGCTVKDCPDANMFKSGDLSKCMCHVGYEGSAAEWNKDTMQYSSSSCEAVPCPAGATCDLTLPGEAVPVHPCADYYAGHTQWDADTQTWANNCSVAACPANSRALVGTNGVPTGCQCHSGFSPAVVWVPESQSYTGCESEVVCPGDAASTDANARDELTNGKLCSCSAGYVGKPVWNVTQSQYTHSCSRYKCPTGSSIHQGSTVCDCDIGWVGGLQWSFDIQNYVGSCQPADCDSDAGVDCTHSTNAELNRIPGTLDCVPGYLSRTVWVPTNTETGAEAHWNNRCEWVFCPANSVRVSTGVCACRWGYAGTVSWDQDSQSFLPNCQPVACPEPAVDNGDGHCVCPRGSEEGSCAFNANDEWVCTCSATVACETNASPVGESADCTCDEGYSGTSVLNSQLNVLDNNQTTAVALSSSRGGKCDPVSCPVNSKAGSFPACSCASGFEGAVTWNVESQSWTSSCQPKACPAGSHHAPVCVPKKGYLSTLVWNFDTQDWDGAVTLATCPTNAVAGTSSAGVPTCNCARGYSGSPSWVAGTGWTHTCSLVDCPGTTVKVTEDSPLYEYPGHTACNAGLQGLASAVLEAPSATCLASPDCLRDYGERACDALVEMGGECWGFDVDTAGVVSLYSMSAVNTAVCDSVTGLKPAAAHTMYKRRARKGDCKCPIGYTGAFPWSNGEYDGQCTKAACPVHAECSTTVRCAEGHTGAASFTWSAELQRWDGQCEAGACLGNATGFPGCSCKAGHTGQQTWDYEAEEWTGTCLLADCPEFAEGDSPSCSCQAGYVRSDKAPNTPVTWDFAAQKWKQSCEPVACPLNSNQARPGECDCNMGYKGHPVFNMDTATYTVHNSSDLQGCVKVSCPSDSTESTTTIAGRAVPSCKCNVGFASQINWDPATFSWGSCAQQECPIHTDGFPHCVCDPGFLGTVTWNGTDYDSTCKESTSSPVWERVHLDQLACTKLHGAGSATVAGEKLLYSFDSDSTESTILRCQLKTNAPFTKVKGSFAVTATKGDVLNNYAITLFNSPYVTAAHSFVAFGTPYSIVLPGMEQDATRLAEGISRVTDVPQTSVSQMDRFYFEVSQPAGVELEISDIQLDAYFLPQEIIKIVRQN